MRTFFLLLLCCISLFKANSQPGSLDPTFGNQGIQTTAFFSNTDTSNTEGRIVLTDANGAVFVMIRIDDNPISMKIAKYLPDGRLDSSYGNGGYSDAVTNAVGSSLHPGATFQGDKIIVAGITDVPGNNDFAISRYTAKGKVDSSFGVNGKVTTDFYGYVDVAEAIVLQGDKIIAGGFADNSGKHRSDFALARYTADGALDTTFGVNGKVVTDFGNSSDNAHSIALQGDKIVVGGFRTNYDVDKIKRDFVLARYTADGKLDRSFGANGKVITNLSFHGSEDLPQVAYSIAMQGDNILVGGATGSDFSYFILERYFANGALDNSFGSFGSVTTEFNGSHDYVNLMALQGDKIVVAAGSSESDFALSRYTADGKVDADFGVNGKVTTDFKNSEDRANSIALQGDKIILVGHSEENLALARYTADGALDASFGEQGLLTFYFPSTRAYFLSTVIQGNKIIAAGSTLNDKNSYDFALARYANDGALDSTFGVNGKVTTDFNNSSDGANSVALQGDKILVGGNTIRGYSDSFALARYTTDGTLDSSFGVNGKVTTYFGDSYDYAIAIALQNNKIIVYGRYSIVRYTADGALDLSFGVNGRVKNHFDGSSIVLQENRIIAAGRELNNNNSDFALVRYTADGTLDSSFGKKGKVLTDFNSSSDFAEAIVLQGDKIIAGGVTSNYPSYPYNADIGVARYTADGTLDSTFGVNGKVITDFGPNDEVTSIALQGDKIIVGGYIYYSNSSYMILARYTADGTLDSSFGMNGKVITDAGDNAALHGIAVHQNRLYAVGGTNLFGSEYGLIAAYQLETPEPAQPAITITDVTVYESKRFAVVTARLSAPTKETVRVHFTTRDKTAIHNQDYIGVSGPILFIPGVNTTFKLPIPIINNNQQEGDEQFEIVLSNAHNATIQDSVAVVTITDDDNAMIAKQNASSFKINVNPNPSIDAFNVQLPGTNLKQTASVRVYDISGRLIEQRNNISIGQSLRLGDRYKAGTYIIEVVQGSQKVRKEVIKTGK